MLYASKKKVKKKEVKFHLIKALKEKKKQYFEILNNLSLRSTLHNQEPSFLME